MPSSDVCERQPLMFNNQFSVQVPGFIGARNDFHLDPMVFSAEIESQIRNAWDIAHVPPNESWRESLTRHAWNAGYSVLRNLASVGVPTFAREMARRTLSQQMEQGSTAAGVVGAVVAGAAWPIGLQVYGLWRDNENHTQTKLSIASRVVQIVATGGTFVALAATGGAPALAAAAPALMAANIVYTPLRDLVQYNLRLENNAKSTNERPRSNGAIGISATAYALNQIGVGYVMDYLSSVLTPNTQPESLQITSQDPSTSSTLTSEELSSPSSLITTTDAPKTWNEGLAKGLGNSLGRGLINVIGETVDDMVSGYSQALLNGTNDGRPLTYSLDFRPADRRSLTEALDQFADAHAPRSNSAAIVLNIISLISLVTNKNQHAVIVIAGAILGLLYPISVMTRSRPGEVNSNSAGNRGIEIVGIPPIAGNEENSDEIEASSNGEERQAVRDTTQRNQHRI